MSLWLSYGRSDSNQPRQPYRYYRCRHAYDKNTGHECSARYVSADSIEEAVRLELVRVLANPDLILREMKELASQEDTDAEEIERLERELQAAEQREKKLLKLFMLEDLSEESLREEASNLKRQREQLGERLQILRRTRSDAREPVDTAQLCLIGHAIETWLENASADQWTLALEALQVSVEATRQRVILRGILPGEAPKFITIEQTSA